jgi:hypothetical protein
MSKQVLILVIVLLSAIGVNTALAGKPQPEPPTRTKYFGQKYFSGKSFHRGNRRIKRAKRYRTKRIKRYRGGYMGASPRRGYMSITPVPEPPL